MKKLVLLVLTLIITVTACAPSQTVDPKTDPASSAASVTKPVKKPSAVPTTPQTSNVPLSESLLLVRYNRRAETHQLTAIDPANGHELARVAPISLEQDYSYVVAPNRKSLAVMSYAGKNYPHAGDLLLIDLEDWSTRMIDLGLKEWNATMAYSPDSRLIALASMDHKNTVLIVDVLQGKLLAQGKADLPVQRMKFTADSTSLMVYGTPRDKVHGAADGNPVVGLLDAGDLSWQWRVELPEIRDGLYRKEGTTGDLYIPGNSFFVSPGVIFAPKDDVLYIVSAEENELTSVDFTARSLQTRAIHPEMSWLDQLLALTAGRAQAKGMNGNEKYVMISPDGRFLYISGAHSEVIEKKENNPEFHRASLGLQIVRTADAVETGKFDTESTDMMISPDGKYLYLRNWINKLNSASPFTDVFDTAQGKIIASVDNFYLTPTYRLDGQPALVSGYSTDSDAVRMASFGTGSMDPLHEWEIGGYATWLVLP